MSYDAQHYQTRNDVDTLYAIVSAPGPWTTAGSVLGVPNATDPRRYDFSGLADGVSYTVRVRAGALPATSDIVVATIEPDVVSVPNGPGGLLKSIKITESGQPVDGAAVWVSTDPVGLNVIAGTLYTDAFGDVDFMLDATTTGNPYYVWVQKGGTNFNNPTTISVP